MNEQAGPRAAATPMLDYEAQSNDPAIRRRWAVVALLFVATAINYLDRQTLSVLGPTLRTELHLTDRDYSNAVSAFLFSYAVMYTLAGRWIDYVGVRIGMAACVAWWSIATMLTALARGPLSLIGARFLLGIGEPGVFPAGMKACGELFPPKARAMPIGIFSSGVSVGAVLAPPLIGLLAIKWGWQAAFIIPGAIGLLWLPLWFLVYKKPVASHLTPAGEVEVRTPWLAFLRQRKVWGLLLARFGSDPVWYFYLFWLPTYLSQARGMTLTQIALFAWIPYVFADIGNVVGGWFTDRLISRGWTPARARVFALCCVALLAPFGAFVGFAETQAQVIAVACLIAFLCQVWSTNTATLAADICGPGERGTVMGMMGTCGSIGGIFFNFYLPYVIATSGYPGAFIVAALLHPMGVILLLAFLWPNLRAGKQSTANDPEVRHA